jgi:hypothetical protein
VLRAVLPFGNHPTVRQVIPWGFVHAATLEFRVSINPYQLVNNRVNHQALRDSTALRPQSHCELATYPQDTGKLVAVSQSLRDTQSNVGMDSKRKINGGGGALEDVEDRASKRRKLPVSILYSISRLGRKCWQLWGVLRVVYGRVSIILRRKLK